MLLKNSIFRVFNFWFLSCNFKNFEQKDSKKCNFYSRCAWYVVKIVFLRRFEFGKSMLSRDFEVTWTWNLLTLLLVYGLFCMDFFRNIKNCFLIENEFGIYLEYWKNEWKPKSIKGSEGERNNKKTVKKTVSCGQKIFRFLSYMCPACGHLAYFWENWKSRTVENPMVSTVFDGPSDETWTHDLLTPSQARYQLRHTRICCFGDGFLKPREWL